MVRALSALAQITYVLWRLCNISSWGYGQAWKSTACFLESDVHGPHKTAGISSPAAG